MLVIVENLFVQLSFLVGIILLYGALISLCSHFFYDACGDKAFFLVRLTGYVGTPVHELSHALMCLLFGHQIKKIQLFNPKKKSKTLGYVEHTYYKRNVYHLLGNFFIGISPILAGGGVIILLMMILLPGTFRGVNAGIAAVRTAAAGTPGEAFFGQLWDAMKNTLSLFFSRDNLKNPFFWVCSLLIFCVAIHMEISRSDIRLMLKGLFVIAVGFLLADLILGFMFPDALTAVTVFCMNTGIGMCVFFLIPAAFSGLIGCISLVMAVIRIIAKDQKKAAKIEKAQTKALTVRK